MSLRFVCTTNMVYQIPGHIVWAMHLGLYQEQEICSIALSDSCSVALQSGQSKEWLICLRKVGINFHVGRQVKDISFH